MQETIGILIGIVIIGFFVLFWICLFTKQDIKFMNKDISRLEKSIERSIDKLQKDIIEIRYKK